jgi:hypothetical protein
MITIGAGDSSYRQDRRGHSSFGQLNHEQPKQDNLSAHKGPAAEQAIRERGVWLLFLPPYSPDLNPIEMAFAKLKAHLRAMAMRTIDELMEGHRANLRSLHATGMRYFKTAGYGFT